MGATTFIDSCDVTRQGNDLVLRCAGRLDDHTARSLTRRLFVAADDRPARVVVDFRDATIDGSAAEDLVFRLRKIVRWWPAELVVDAREPELTAVAV